MDQVIDDHPTSGEGFFARLRARLLFGGSLRRAADLVALIYIGFIATVATVTGAYYMLFPELSALSWDVMELPGGRWACAPLMLAFTPALTGLIGTLATRTLPYGFVSVLLTVSVCVGVIRAMRSPIAPAISAGLLPLVLGVTSWWYAPSILFGTCVLAVISFPWKRYAAAHPVSRKSDTDPAGPPFTEPPFAEPANDDRAPAATDASPSGGAPHAAAATSATAVQSNAPFSPFDVPMATAARHLLAPLMVFVAIAMVAVKLTGERFILFPPLVVILYEMLSHREHCPWVGRPIALPTACFLSAMGGYLFFAHIASAPIVAMLSMAWGIAVLRTLNLHMPPVLAVALLPLVMTNPTIGYTIAVGLGTTLASAWFEFLCWWPLIDPLPATFVS